MRGRPQLVLLTAFVVSACAGPTGDHHHNVLDGCRLPSTTITGAMTAAREQVGQPFIETQCYDFSGMDRETRLAVPNALTLDDDETRVSIHDNVFWQERLAYPIRNGDAGPRIAVDSIDWFGMGPWSPWEWQALDGAIELRKAWLRDAFNQSLPLMIGPPDTNIRIVDNVFVLSR